MSKNRMKLSDALLKNILLEGLPIPSSTVFTGPAGSGKPIIALAIISSWLKNGGSVVAAPLQFPNQEFISGILKDFYGTGIQNYEQNFVYVQFDTNVDSVETVNQNQMKANLVKPENWDRMIAEAKKMTKKSDLGLMLFSTALNLPLFSPTYSDRLMDKIQQMFDAREMTYVFCVSTSMLKKKAVEVGEMADNQIEVWFSERAKNLLLKVKKMKDVAYLKDEIEAPFTQAKLEETEKISKKYKVTEVLQRIKRI
ncbi:MAG: hypothetical protein KAU23_04830 [Anaerolineales bacterium]|nr:hypothetical protein [Anaerolineales bacterium]